MAKILSEAQCVRIKTLNKKFRPFTDKGWMCEGSEFNSQPCNILFNNNTDESFLSAYDGTILELHTDQEPLENVKLMAKIQGDIRLVCEGEV